MKTNTVKNSLDGFILYYEELEKKKVAKKSKVLNNKTQTETTNSKSGKKIALKARLAKVWTTIKAWFHNVVNKVKLPRKKAKKLTKAEQKASRQQQMRGILGIGLLFVVVSITYSSYVIFNGVDGIASRVMLVPQVVFALLTLFKAFSKIYK